MLTVIAFIVAIGLLVAIHEYGHFQVARWCGVKVLRFAIGFGQPLLRWKSKDSDTEFALCMLPLGGYVKMLDEREGEVDPAERHLAFNTQPVWKRFLIVAAGPVANLLLAFAIYAGVAWHGVQMSQPIVAEPPAQSMAAQAGLRSGDRIVQWRRASADSWKPAVSMEDVLGEVMYAAIDKEDVRLQVQAQDEKNERTLTVPLHLLKPGQEADKNFASVIGLRPYTAPVPTIRALQTGGAADKGGLKVGDTVLQVNAQPVTDASALQRMIQGETAGAEQVWRVDRAGQTMVLQIRPVVDPKDKLGKVGIEIGGMPATVMVRYGFFDSLEQGAKRVWEVSAISIKGFAKMLTGQLSVKNLSGPVTIASYAGKSVHAGWDAYLVFLGLISVSLGVLNLLPVPVLDGGHLMYYLWEAVTGKPVSDLWLERMQKVGLVLLGGMMLVATFNDISRHLG